MNIRNVFAIFALLLLMATTNAYGYGGNYQELFYPDGMPVKEGYYATGPTVYHYYGHVEIPAASILYILYAEEIRASKMLENQYTVYIATVNKSGPDISDLSLITKLDVTEYINIGMEIPGDVAELGCLIDIFPLTDGQDFLHLSIAGRLSGSGGILSSSDIFFLVDTENHSLSPILKLLDSARFGRAGRGQVKYYYTTFYTLNNEETGTQILTQDFSYELDAAKGIDQGVLNPDINVYQYDFDNNKYSIVDMIQGIPRDASLIERVVELDTECTSGCDQ